MEANINGRKIVGFIPILPDAPGFVSPVFSVGDVMCIQNVSGGRLTGYSQIDLDFRVKVLEPFWFSPSNSVLYGFYIAENDIVFDTGSGLANFLQTLRPFFPERKALQRSIDTFIAKIRSHVVDIIDHKRSGPSETVKPPEPSAEISAWTNERVAKLKFLWSEGLSASQIAAQLGGISRNAVIGKAHKLNLPGRTRGPSIESHSIAAKSSATTRYRHEANDEENAQIPVFKGLALAELTERSCKWPIGDPLIGDFNFCGQDSPDLSPYCSYHARLAYQHVKDIRNQPPYSGDEILPLSLFANVVGLKKVR